MSNVTKMPPALRPRSFKEAQFVRKTYHGEPLASDTADDVLRREYWTHFRSKGIRAGEKIELLWEGRTKYAEILVLDTDEHGFGVCFIREPVELGVSMPAIPATYSIEDAGPHVGYRILRDSDKHVMDSHIEDMEDAQARLKKLNKAA